MGKSTVFQGINVKLLKENLKFKDAARILTGAADPTLVATEGEKGSLYMRQGPIGELYIKLDNGTTTNWRITDTSSLDITIANNQVAPANITNFLVDPATTEAFSSEYIIRRRRTFTVGGTHDDPFYTNLGTGFNFNVTATALQPDGKILVGGAFSTLDSVTRTRLVRLNADGTHDDAFYTNLGTSFNAQILTIAVQPDGKILVGGDFSLFKGVTRRNVVRLNADGTEDVPFYTNLGASFTNRVKRIIVQPDGKILVGGIYSLFNSVTRNRLLRLNADGTEDTAFYTNLGSGFNNEVSDITIQLDGKILVCGAYSIFNSVTRNRLLRLNADGTEDTAFYTNLGTGFPSTVITTALQPDGKILVGGAFSTLDSITRNRFLRLEADGTVDTAFYTNLGTGFNSTVSAVAIQPDGKILIGGSFVTFDSVTKNRLLRLNADGTEDTAFYTNLGTGFDQPATNITIQPDRKILVGGSFVALDGVTRNRLIRLNGDFPATEVIKKGQFQGYHKPSTNTWELGGYVSIGDDVGVTFSMLPSGQLQYTSTDIPATISEESIRFSIKRL